MKKVMLILAFLACSALPAPASVVNDDGYVPTIVNGVTYYQWPSTGVMYTRTDSWSWIAGYWQWNGYCYIWRAGYWQFNGYNYTRIELKQDSFDDQDIIDLAKARDAGVLKIAAEAKRREGRAALIKQLGLEGNFNIPGYGQGTFGYSTTAVAQGATVYQTLTLEAKGADINSLLQMYGQAVQDQLKYGDAAHARLATTVDNLVDKSERIRQTLANSAAAPQAAQAIKKVIDPGTDVKATVTTPVQPVPQPVLNTKFIDLSGPAKCMKCHGPDKEHQKDFDISLYDPKTASAADVLRVLKYVKSTDPKFSCGTASGRTNLTDGEESQFARGR